MSNPLNYIGASGGLPRCHDTDQRGTREAHRTVTFMQHNSSNGNDREPAKTSSNDQHSSKNTFKTPLQRFLSSGTSWLNKRTSSEVRQVVQHANTPTEVDTQPSTGNTLDPSKTVVTSQTSTASLKKFKRIFTPYKTKTKRSSSKDTQAKGLKSLSQETGITMSQSKQHARSIPGTPLQVILEDSGRSLGKPQDHVLVHELTLTGCREQSKSELPSSYSFEDYNQYGYSQSAIEADVHGKSKKLEVPKKKTFGKRKRTSIHSISSAATGQTRSTHDSQRTSVTYVGRNAAFQTGMGKCSDIYSPFYDPTPGLALDKRRLANEKLKGFTASMAAQIQRADKAPRYSFLDRAMQRGHPEFIGCPPQERCQPPGREAQSGHVQPLTGDMHVEGTEQIDEGANKPVTQELETDDQGQPVIQEGTGEDAVQETKDADTEQPIIQEGELQETLPETEAEEAKGEETDQVQPETGEHAEQDKQEPAVEGEASTEPEKQPSGVDDTPQAGQPDPAQVTDETAGVEAGAPTETEVEPSAEQAAELMAPETKLPIESGEATASDQPATGQEALTEEEKQATGVEETAEASPTEDATKVEAAATAGLEGEAETSDQVQTEVKETQPEEVTESTTEQKPEAQAAEDAAGQSNIHTESEAQAVQPEPAEPAETLDQVEKKDEAENQLAEQAAAPAEPLVTEQTEDQTEAQDGEQKPTEAAEVGATIQEPLPTDADQLEAEKQQGEGEEAPQPQQEEPTAESIPQQSETVTAAAAAAEKLDSKEHGEASAPDGQPKGEEGTVENTELVKKDTKEQDLTQVDKTEASAKDAVVTPSTDQLQAQTEGQGADDKKNSELDAAGKLEAGVEETAPGLVETPGAETVTGENQQETVESKQPAEVEQTKSDVQPADVVGQTEEQTAVSTAPPNPDELADTGVTVEDKTLEVDDANKTADEQQEQEQQQETDVPPDAEPVQEQPQTEDTDGEQAKGQETEIKPEQDDGEIKDQNVDSPDAPKPAELAETGTAFVEPTDQPTITSLRPSDFDITLKNGPSHTLSLGDEIPAGESKVQDGGADYLEYPHSSFMPQQEVTERTDTGGVPQSTYVDPSQSVYDMRSSQPMPGSFQYTPYPAGYVQPVGQVLNAVPAGYCNQIIPTACVPTYPTIECVINLVQTGPAGPYYPIYTDLNATQSTFLDVTNQMCLTNYWNHVQSNGPVFYPSPIRLEGQCPPSVLSSSVYSWIRVDWNTVTVYTGNDVLVYPTGPDPCPKLRELLSRPYERLSEEDKRLMDLLRSVLGLNVNDTENTIRQKLAMLGAKDPNTLTPEEAELLRLFGRCAGPMSGMPGPIGTPMKDGAGMWPAELRSSLEARIAYLKSKPAGSLSEAERAELNYLMSLVASAPSNVQQPPDRLNVRTRSMEDRIAYLKSLKPDVLTESERLELEYLLSLPMAPSSQAVIRSPSVEERINQLQSKDPSTLTEAERLELENLLSLPGGPIKRSPSVEAVLQDLIAKPFQQLSSAEKESLMVLLHIDSEDTLRKLLESGKQQSTWSIKLTPYDKMTLEEKRAFEQLLRANPSFGMDNARNCFIDYSQYPPFMPGAGQAAYFPVPREKTPVICFWPWPMGPQQHPSAEQQQTTSQVGQSSGQQPGKNVSKSGSYANNANVNSCEDQEF